MSTVVLERASLMKGAGYLLRQSRRPISGEAADRMNKLSAGDESAGHKLPCLFRESAAEGVVKLLQSAVDAGGKLVLGDLKRKNAIIQPHLIDKCPLDCDLFIHESFGPVITVSRVNDGIQAMIDLVNSSEYTLTNSVFGSNIEDCMTVAKGMRSGSAHINGPIVSVIRSEVMV